MALPVLDKVWLKDFNNAFAASAVPLTDHRNLMLGIKNALKAFGGVPPTVKGSSDGAGAGAMDNADRWAAIANLVWAAPGANHSWIVLQFAPIAATFQICIDLTPLDAGVQGPKITVLSSITGFNVGGTATNRPTAADEKVQLAGAQWIGTGPATPTFSSVAHLWQSNDGVATRVVVHIANVPVALWTIEKPQNPIAGWANPHAVSIVGATSLLTSVLTYARLWSVSTGHANVNGTDASLWWATEAYGGQAAGMRRITPGDISTEYDHYSIAIQSETAPARERLSGRVAAQRGMWDLFFGCSARGLPADCYPLSGDREMVQFGCLILPWDGTFGVPGSVPLTA